MFSIGGVTRRSTIHLLTLSLIVFASCRERDIQVECVVPDGFHGIFVIEEDRINGVSPEFEGDLIRYTIPKSGRLVTSDAEPLYNWHSARAVYSSGDKIEQVLGPPGDKHILIGLETVGSGANVRVLNMIGTQAEAEEYWKTKTIWFRIESDHR